MPATIVLEARDDTRDTFNSVNRSLDQLEANAEKAGVPVDHLMDEMSAADAREFAQAVDGVNARLVDLRQKAEAADDEIDRLTEQRERMEGLSNGITAVGTAFSALKDGAEILAQGAEVAWEVINKLAEEGDEGMIRLRDSVNEVGSALNRLGGESIRLSLGGDAGAAARQVDLLASSIDALSERLKTFDANDAGTLAQILSGNFGAAAVTARGFGGTVEAAEQARQEREREAEMTRAREARGAVDEALAAQAFDRQIAEIENLEEINRLTQQRRTLLNEMAEGRVGGDEQLVAEEILKLEARRQEMIQERARAEADAAREATRAHEQAAREQTRIFEQAAKERAAFEADQNKRVADERVRLAKEVADRETAIERQEAEVRKLMQEEAEQKRQILQDRVTGGGGFDVREAVNQVREGRIRQATEDFMAGGGGRGLSQDQLREEMERIRRAETRRTYFDAQRGTLHQDELAAAQNKLAGVTAETADAAVQTGRAAVETLTEVRETVGDALGELARLRQELYILKHGFQGQLQRDRDQRRGLNGG